MALPTASDNEFPKVILAMQSSDATVPTDSDWKLYAKADGIYARSSNTIAGPFIGTSTLSIGSNSTDVAPSSGLGGSTTTFSPATHTHRGVRQIAHSSNTFAGDLTIVPAGGLGFSASGNTITLSAPVSGSGSSTAIPGWLSAFVGTTDATNFYWDGNDLAGFTEQTVTGTATWIESQNLVTAVVANQTADDVSAKLIAKTISTGDSWYLAIRADALQSGSAGTTTGNRSLGIIMTDGTATTSNCVAGHIQISNDATNVLLVGRHGTLTAISTAPWVSQDIGDNLGGWLFVKLTYVAANTFRVAFGSSGVDAAFQAFGEADISKTMTPTHIGICGWNSNAQTAILTFGPLRKT